MYLIRIIFFSKLRSNKPVRSRKSCSAKLIFNINGKETIKKDMKKKLLTQSFLLNIQIIFFYKYKLERLSK